MSLNTIGAIDITDLARDELNDNDASDYEFSDALLNRWLVSLVRRYSKARPYIKETTVTEVEDQDLYALSSEVWWLIECQYRMAFDEDVYEPMEETTIGGYTTYDWPALDMIRRNLRVFYDRIGHAAWEVVTCLDSYTSGKYLMVYPAPSSSGDTFTIRYACAHPLSGTDYHTIPVEHADYFVDLLMARGLRRRATEKMQGPFDYDAGQTRVRRSGVQYLLREARALEAGVWNALRDPVIRAG